MKITEIIWNNKEKILFIFYVFLLLAIAVIIIAGVSSCFRSIFYDNWIWKYYWGPVVADALNSAHGTAVS
jgi:uncharacterized membrane protein YkvI